MTNNQNKGEETTKVLVCKKCGQMRLLEEDCDCNTPQSGDKNRCEVCDLFECTCFCKCGLPKDQCVCGFTPDDFIPQSVDKDTNSQDSIQVGNESIQTNTLGTTMEERLATEYKEYENREVELSREKIIRFWLKELAQSKTDLLNALIEREGGMRKDMDTVFYDEDGYTRANAKGYNKALEDTINHLKSLRDETN